MRRKLLIFLGLLPLVAATSATHCPAKKSPIWRIETPKELQDHYRDLLEPHAKLVSDPSPDEEEAAERARELLLKNSTEKPPVQVKTIGGPATLHSEEKPPSDIHRYIPESETYIINFTNIEMTQYLKFVAQLTHTSFVYKDEDLKFRVTILSESPATVEQVI